MNFIQKLNKIIASYNALPRIKKLENAVIISSLFFIFKIASPSSPNAYLVLINELFMFLLLSSWIYYTIEVIHEKSEQPMMLVVNSGILIAAVYFLMIVTPDILTEAFSKNANLAEKLIGLILNFTFLAAGIASFVVLRELFFLRQKKNPKFYFDVMLWTLIIIFFVRLLIALGLHLVALVSALYVVAVIIFTINSIRVAWIAFLTKREKITLLFVSIILSIIFGLTYSLTSSSEGALNIALNGFSPGFHALFNLIMLYGTIAFGVVFFTTLFHLPTAAAFEKKAEEVSSLTDFTNLMTNALDFKELAENLTKHTLQLIGADIAWLYVNRNGEFDVEASTNLGKREAKELTTVVLADFKNKIPTDLTAQKEKAINISVGEAVRTLNFETLILAPLRIHGEINGCLFIGSFNYFPFDEDDRKTVKAFADYAAVAMENSLLIQKSIEKERLEKELDIARDIQHKIIPSKLPRLKNLQISASFIPAFEVGGDYYDFSTATEDETTFILADVSGKGISAAFVMAEIKGIFESLARTVQSPREMLSKMNALLDKSLGEKEFVTAIGGIINTSSGVLKISRAGHTPALLVRNGKVIHILPKGIGLGFDNREVFENVLEEESFKLESNDLILLFTDGVTDAQNKYSEFFGIKRLENILTENSLKSPDEISEILVKEVTLFSKDVPQRDDITFVIFKWMNE